MEDRDENWWYDRKLNMRRNLLVLCETPGISERFLYMNDDFMLVKPWDENLPTPVRGTIRAFADGDIEAQEGAIPDTYRWLRAQGVDDPWYVSEHVPLFVVKERLAHWIRQVWHIPGFVYPFVWGNLEDVPLVDDGKVGGDWLLVKEHLHKESWPEHQWSVSTVHRSFYDWPVGERLRNMFPEPSRYER